MNESDKEKKRRQMDDLLIELHKLPSITEEGLEGLGPFLSRFIRPVDTKSVDLGDLNLRESEGCDAYLCSVDGTLEDQRLCLVWAFGRGMCVCYAGSSLVDRHRKLIDQDVLQRPAEKWIARLDMHELTDFFTGFFGEREGGPREQELAALRQEIDTDLRQREFPECQADAVLRNRLLEILRRCWGQIKKTELHIIGPHLLADALDEDN